MLRLPHALRQPLQGHHRGCVGLQEGKSCLGQAHRAAADGAIRARENLHKLHSGCLLRLLCLFRGLLQAAGEHHQQEAWTFAKQCCGDFQTASAGAGTARHAWYGRCLHIGSKSAQHRSSVCCTTCRRNFSAHVHTYVHRPGAACLVMQLVSSTITQISTIDKCHVNTGLQRTAASSVCCNGLESRQHSRGAHVSGLQHASPTLQEATGAKGHTHTQTPCAVQQCGMRKANQPVAGQSASRERRLLHLAG